MPEVLICNPDRTQTSALAARFLDMGWTVHATHEEAEAGYRLLLWNQAEELPALAILRLTPAKDLVDFCRILAEEDVTEYLPIVGWLEPQQTREQRLLRRLGIETVRHAEPIWPPMRDLLIDLGLHPQISKRVDSQDKGIPPSSAPRQGSTARRRLSSDERS